MSIGFVSLEKTPCVVIVRFAGIYKVSDSVFPLAHPPSYPRNPEEVVSHIRKSYDGQDYELNLKLGEHYRREEQEIRNALGK